MIGLNSVGDRIGTSGSYTRTERDVGIHRSLSEDNQPEESMLSQSLGAYPAFNLPTLQRRESDPANQIYHAGYLLKRSNNPVAIWPENVSSPTQEGKFPQTQESSCSTLYDLDSASAIRTSERTPLDEHADLFVADWGDDMMANAPKLQPASDLMVGHEQDEDDGENDATCYPTTEPIISLAFRASKLSASTDAQASPAQPQSPEQKQQIKKEEQKRNEIFLNMAADFLGLPRPIETKKSSQSSRAAQKQRVSLATAAEEKMEDRRTKRGNNNNSNSNRSTPIRMPSTPKSPTTTNASSNTLPENQAPSSTGSNKYHRSQSERVLPPQSGQPVDFRDDKGHVWRSKYCILQDGVLYFYRNEEDAQSPEAKAERSDVNTNPNPFETSNNPTFDPESLARSPIPRRLLVKAPSSPQESTTHLWEKRVRVEAIGAVRSAEAKYGPNSFALLSPPKDDDDNQKRSTNQGAGEDVSIENADDKLILMARNATERGDWIFQFHRSIGIFVKNMINDSLGMPTASGGYAGGSFRAPKPVPRHHELPQIQPRKNWGRTRHQDGLNDSLFTPPRRPKLKTGVTSTSGTSDWGAQKANGQRVTSTSTATTASLSPDTMMLSPSSPLANNVISPTRIASNVPGTPPSEAAATAASTAAQISQGASGARREVSPPIDFVERNDVSPELSAPCSNPETERPPAPKPGKYVPPALRRLQQQQQQQQGEQQRSADPPQPPKVFRKYVPPSLREKQKQSDKVGKPKEVKKYVPPSKRNKGSKPFAQSNASSSLSSNDKPTAKPTQHQESPERVNPDPRDVKPFQMGGCADPRIVKGSVLDSVFVPRKASRLERKLRTDPYGKLHHISNDKSWDVGAVSECGVRDANEDAYLISENLFESFADAKGCTLKDFSSRHPPGLFCIFDGHAGDQAARYASERLTDFLEKGSRASAQDADGSAFTQKLIRDALMQLDAEFCKFCVEGGRQWESGATALVAALIDERLIVGNLGDARAVVSRSVDACDVSDLVQNGWSSLPDGDHSGSRSCLWKDVSTSHHPSREDELKRIEAAGGWITYESDIYVDRLKRVDLHDSAVVDILQRCFADRYSASPTKAAAPQRVVESSRVCGELAVSRAIGDRDFKAAFNQATENGVEGAWDSPFYLCFPPDHCRSFNGDLITSEPEFHTLPMGGANTHEEFFLLACDGLWDVMDSDDAVRVTRELLFDLKWPASEAARRLAEIAVHLGSADNVTVIVVAMDSPSD